MKARKNDVAHKVKIARGQLDGILQVPFIELAVEHGLASLDTAD